MEWVDDSFFLQKSVPPQEALAQATVDHSHTRDEWAGKSHAVRCEGVREDSPKKLIIRFFVVI